MKLLPMFHFVNNQNKQDNLNRQPASPITPHDSKGVQLPPGVPAALANLSQVPVSDRETILGVTLTQVLGPFELMCSQVIATSNVF